MLVTQASATAVYGSPDYQVPRRVVLTTLNIGGLIGNSSDARYNRLLRAVAGEMGITLDIHPVPGNRLTRQFVSTATGCLFPDYRAPEGVKVIVSAPFNQAIVHLVTLKSRFPEPIHDIIDRNIGTVSGYSYDFMDLSKARGVARVESEKQNLRLLLFGRVDATLAYFPDLPLAASGEEMAQLSYDKSYRLSTSPERLACFDTPENKVFLNHFAGIVARFAKTGQLESLLAPYFYGLPEAAQEEAKGEAVGQ